MIQGHFDQLSLVAAGGIVISGDMGVRNTASISQRPAETSRRDLRTVVRAASSFRPLSGVSDRERDGIDTLEEA